MKQPPQKLLVPAALIGIGTTLFLAAPDRSRIDSASASTINANANHPQSAVQTGESSGLQSPPILRHRPTRDTSAEESKEQLSGMIGAELLPEREQASLWQAFSEARREIRPITEHQKGMPENAEAVFLASNPAQHLRARFLKDGLRVLSSDPNRDWECLISLATDNDPDIHSEDTRLEYVRPGILEWYHNAAQGIEHGFIVDQKHSSETGHSSGLLVVPVLVEGLSVEALADRDPESSDLQFVNAAGEPVISYTDLKAWDARGTALEATMEPTPQGLAIHVADAGATFPITIDPLIASLESKLGPEVLGTADTGDQFGYSVSLDGNTALIGAFGDDDNGSGSGSAYVFTRSAGTWAHQQKLTASDPEIGDQFGYSLSVDGDIALVGANGEDSGGNNSGSAYAFIRTGTTWSQQQKFTPTDAADDDQFGWSVSLDGDTALIGAYRDDGIDLEGGYAPDQGSVYVFRIAIIGTDTDGDGASDTWELANGFNPSVAWDFATLDSDNDGDLDLLEIYQGTDKASSSSRHGLLPESTSGATQTMTARYRRTTDSTGVIANYLWSLDLKDWYRLGMTASGVKVEFAESVVSVGVGYEIVELTATITIGSSDHLFIALEVIPFE